MLKDRWRGDGQRLAREAVERLIAGSSLEGLGLGEVDGRTDLRGLWLVSAREVPTASRVTWRGVDLSGSTMRIDLDRATVEDVRFDRVGWRDWSVRSSVLRDCSFVGADLRDAQLDAGNSGLQGEDRAPATPSTYAGCDFARTRTGPYGGFGRATFEECVFADTAFPSPVWFRGARLDGCVFRGRFRTVCFGWTGPYDEPAPWLDVDVRDAEFASLEVHAHSGPGLRR